MIKNYIMNAYDLNDLTNRLSILNKLSRLAPGAEFYASDLGLSAGTVSTLDREGIISCVRGKERYAFLCVDKYKELYKKVSSKCWKVSPTLCADFTKVCSEMVALYSAQMLALSRD